jgi:hypothetical protein
MVLAATGAAVLSIELIAALAAAPHLRNALASPQGRALLKAGDAVWSSVAANTSSSLRQLAGDAVLFSVHQASRVYGAMLRATPEDLVVRRSWAIEVVAAPATAAARVVECSVDAATCAGGRRCAPAESPVPAVTVKPHGPSRLWSRVLTTS